MQFSHFLIQLLRTDLWVRRLLLAGLLGAVALAGVVGYDHLRSNIELRLYQDRLRDLSGKYQTLRDQYNEAVRKTAVTELVVEDGELSVEIRTAEGALRRIETPFDPDQEIYVDYIVLDGRLWIRRVFDEQTSPRSGLVIDPPLAELDWSDPRLAHGKAVYRQLGEGRWVVTVTGDGSLGLARRSRDIEPVLSSPPVVKEYEQIRDQIDADVDQVGLFDVLRGVGGADEEP